MSAPSLRTQPVDRRRLSMEERASYKPQKRLGAIARAKAFKSSWASQQKRKPFATEQKPGTGGFTAGISRQQERMRVKGCRRTQSKVVPPYQCNQQRYLQKLAT